MIRAESSVQVPRGKRASSSKRLDLISLTEAGSASQCSLSRRTPSKHSGPWVGEYPSGAVRKKLIAWSTELNSSPVMASAVRTVTRRRTELSRLTTSM
jgi:hypothetical protein